MGCVTVKYTEDDLSYDHFVENTDILLTKDGKDGIGCIKYNCSFLIDQLNQDQNISD